MGIDNLKKQDNKKNVIVSVLKVLLLVAIVVGIPLYIYFFQKDWLSQFRNFDDIISYLQGYKLESIPIYIGIQVLQIVISVIPGQFFNLAAGYLYKIGRAHLLSGSAVFDYRSFSRHADILYAGKTFGKRFCAFVFRKRKDSGIRKKAELKESIYCSFLLISYSRPA